MKIVKICLVLALIMLGSSLLFSQQAPTLSPDQQEQFDSQKLTVTGYKIITISPYGGTTDSGFGPSSLKWDVTEGYKKISEPNFLRIVGLDKDARDSQSNLQAKAWLTWGGLGLFVAGLALVELPLFFPPKTSDGYGGTVTNVDAMLAEFATGAVLGVGGGIMWIIGAGKPQNITPYGRATNLADKYNLQLLIKITGKSQNFSDSAESGTL